MTITEHLQKFIDNYYMNYRFLPGIIYVSHENYVNLIKNLTVEAFLEGKAIDLVTFMGVSIKPNEFLPNDLIVCSEFYE